MSVAASSSVVVALISSITDLFALLALHGIRSSLRQHHNSKLSILLLSDVRIVHDSQPYSTTGKTNYLFIYLFIKTYLYRVSTIQ